VIIFPFSPIAAIPNPKKTLKKMTGIMSPSDIDLKILVGITAKMVSQIPVLEAVFAVARYF